MGDLTYYQDSILRYLSNKMESTAKIIAQDMPRNSKSVGRQLRMLQEQGYVMRIPELKAWRLTKKGRDYVERSITDDTKNI